MCHPAFGRLRQEDLNFEASLDYTIRFCLKTIRTKSIILNPISPLKCRFNTVNILSNCLPPNSNVKTNTKNLIKLD
jgi:hypothetical protein